MSHLLLKIRPSWIAVATGLLCFSTSQTAIAQSFANLQTYPIIAAGWDGNTTFGTGSVTITSTGTTASGVYAFAPSSLNPNAVLATTTSYYAAYDYYSGGTLNVQGGYVDEAYVNEAQMNLDGGQVDNVNGTLSTIDFNGSTVQAYSGVGDTATMESGDVNVVSNYYGQFSMYGGSVDVMDTQGGGVTNITGGSIGFFVNGFDSSLTTISGGTFGSLNTYDQGVIDLIGSGFTDTLNQDGSYTISGLLQNDSTAFTCVYNDYGDTGMSLEFNGATALATPEPAGIAAIGVGIIGLFLRRRK